MFDGKIWLGLHKASQISTISVYLNFNVKIFKRNRYTFGGKKSVKTAIVSLLKRSLL